MGLWKKLTNQIKSTSKSKKRLLFFLLILLILLVVSIVVMTKKKPDTTEEDFYDPTANTGILPGMTESEIRQQLDRIVEEGMLNISINTTIFFPHGEASGKADIVNIENNRYDFKVSITLDKTKERVYQSKGIRPGQYIQYIELEKSLDDGVYDATASFSAYTKEHKLVGNASAKVVLTVGMDSKE